MSDTYCIHCGSARLHRSRRRGRIELAARSLGGRVHRCHDCDTRFVQLGGALIRSNHLTAVAKRLIIAAVMAVAVIVVLSVILWFGRRESPSTPEAAGAAVFHCHPLDCNSSVQT
jgi:hypothetical protein